MSRFGLVFVLLIGHFPFLGQTEERMRSLFFQCSSHDGIAQYYTESQLLNSNIALYRGYKGSALAMIADTKESVKDKYTTFSMGREELEAAIALDPQSYELRFLRYAVQSEVPLIVGYKGQIKEDIDRLIYGFESGAISQYYWYWASALKFIQSSDDKSADQWERLKKYVTTP